MNVKPYKDDTRGRKEQVRKMFDNIAGRYDFLNHLLSFNMDKKWRKQLVDLIKSDLNDEAENKKDLKILDVATGTGDLAFELSKDPRFRIAGLDLSWEMLKIATIKAKAKKNNIKFIHGDSESLPFENNSFDVVTVGFGVRNFEDLKKGLKEISRVLKGGGKIYILEFSKPRKGIFSTLYGLYSSKILPYLASVFGGERKAYNYLPESISEFPSGNEMLLEMQKAGVSFTENIPLSMSIATIYKGVVIK